MDNQESDIQRKLSELRADNSSGARELILKALEIVKSQIQLIQDPNENVRDLIFDLAKKIIDSRPSMANLINTIGYFLQNSDKLNKKFINESLRQFEIDEIVRNKSLEENFLKFLNLNTKSHCNLMLISYSSTIVNLLKKFNNFNLELYILESRPLLEGRKTAEILSQYFRTHLIIDAAIGKFIDQVDLALIGVDSILKDGSIINKIGTFPLAALANIKNKKVYAVCDSFKYNLRSHFGESISIEQKLSKEVYNNIDKNNFLEVHNYYFDVTPPNYITKIISNLGILSVQDFLDQVLQDLPIDWFKYFIHNKKV
ncbi:MAG: hypothetical protein ACFFE5_16825 [Candidatus Thorarchaeota archaeon]